MCGIRFFQDLMYAILLPCHDFIVKRSIKKDPAKVKTLPNLNLKDNTGGKFKSESFISVEVYSKVKNLAFKDLPTNLL